MSKEMEGKSLKRALCVGEVWNGKGNMPNA
jgi:hypothetical protein